MLFFLLQDLPHSKYYRKNWKGEAKYEIYCSQGKFLFKSVSLQHSICWRWCICSCSFSLKSKKSRRPVRKSEWIHVSFASQRYVATWGLHPAGSRGCLGRCLSWSYLCSQQPELPWSWGNTFSALHKCSLESLSKQKCSKNGTVLPENIQAHEDIQVEGSVLEIYTGVFHLGLSPWLS